MINRRTMTVLAACFLATAPVLAQDKSRGPPSASVAIEQIQVAFIGSGAGGGGTLNYRCESHPITVGGLGIGGIGASKLTASGSVYGLDRREDFAGVNVEISRRMGLG